MTKITVNFNEDTSKLLNQLAKLSNCALSTIVERLVHESLIIREDAISVNVIKMREKDIDGRLIAHKIANSGKFKLFMLSQVLKEDIPNLSKPMQKKLTENLPALTIDPLICGSIMNVQNKAFFRFKIESCRVLYSVDAEKHRVNILAIKQRKDLFEDF